MGGIGVFETISKYWASPISNAVMVLAGIFILRPIIKKIAIEQLSAAINAMNEAKNLPNHIAGLVKASEELRGVNRELISLNEKIGQFDLITEQLVGVNRRIDDLQKITEERPPEGPVEATGQKEEVTVDVDSWDTAAELWFAAKEYVEEIIENIPDGRMRRPFNSIQRYRYDEITKRLVGGGFITREKADAINAMDEAFRSIRNRKRSVTPEMVAQFRAWRDAILAPTLVAIPPNERAVPA